ncbi:MAG: hypothetical protein H7222_04445 [Methylotenera sp.]|nr:hypothetical protein [Oligoflexia bacterium]
MIQKPRFSTTSARPVNWYEIRLNPRELMFQKVRPSANSRQASQSQDQKRKVLIRNYLKDKKVLILDSSSLSRSSLGSLLLSLGAKSSQLILVSTLSAALEEFQRGIPAVLISEYSPGSGNTSELFRRQRSLSPVSTSETSADTTHLLSLLMTGDASGGAVGDAARLDVDLVIVKPYSKDGLRELISQKIEFKLSHSAYSQAIRRTKSHILEGDLASAIEAFQIARSIQPATSRFFTEQAQLGQKVVRTGGSSRSIAFAPSFDSSGGRKENFQCLTDLYEVLLKQKNYAGAYRAIQKMMPYFSGESEKVSELFRLATVTGNLSDLHQYYPLFLSTQNRSEALIQTVSSAYLCGAKNYSREKKSSLMRDYLAKAVGVANSRTELATPVLRQAIALLVQAGITAEARAYLRRIPSESSDYLAMEYLIANGDRDSSGQVIDQGWKLLGRGIQDPVIHEILISRLMERGKRDPAENLAHEAARLWPEQSERFRSLTAAPSAETGKAGS